MKNSQVLPSLGKTGDGAGDFQSDLVVGLGKYGDCTVGVFGYIVKAEFNVGFELVCGWVYQKEFVQGKSCLGLMEC